MHITSESLLAQSRKYRNYMQISFLFVKLDVNALDYSLIQTTACILLLFSIFITAFVISWNLSFFTNHIINFDTDFTVFLSALGIFIYVRQCE